MKTIGPILTAVALFLTDIPARAGVMWSVDWSTTKPNVISDTGNNQFLVNAGPHVDGSGNASNLLAGQITMQLPFKGTTDTWTEQNYSLDVHLVDKTSHAATDLLFAGALSGTATPSGSSISNEFVAGKTSYTVTLGGNQYTVALGPYVANGAGTQVGTLEAQVTVNGDTGPTGPPTHQSPEPSTMVLMGLGFASIAATAWKKRRKMTNC
jgi:hypothetical protein